MKKVYVVAGSILTVFAAAYFVRATFHHWSALRSTELDAETLGAMAGAGILYSITFLTSTKTWQLALRCFDAGLDFPRTLQIQLVSQFAKYLPGNIGHHVGRVLLAREAGLATSAVIGSIFMDSLMVLVAAAICSLPSFSLVFGLAGEHAGRAFEFLPLLLTLGALTAIIAWIFRSRWTHRVAVLFSFSRIPLLSCAVLFHCTSFLLGGTALLLLLDALTETPLGFEAVPQIVGVYSAAWMLGFVVPGAPAGLGIREVCLLVGLGQIAGDGTALVAAALLRVVTTLADGLLFLLGLLLRRVSNR